MNRALWSLVLALLLAACGGGGGGGAPPPIAPPPAGPSPADVLRAQLAGLAPEAFYVEAFAALQRRTPEALLWRSLTGLYPPASISLDDWSEPYRRDTLAMAAVALELLEGIDRGALDTGGQLDSDIFEWTLRDQVEGSEFFYHGFPASYSIFGVQEDTRQLFTEIHPLATRADAEDYLTRLAGVEAKFRQLAEHLERQRQRGIVEPLVTLDIALGQVTALAQGSATASPYYTRFVAGVAAMPGIDAALRADLEARALAAVDGPVRRGYELLRQRLQALRGSAPPVIGVGQYPRGGDYYRYVLRHHTTSDLTPAEVHDLGLAELDRIRAEMRSAFDALGYPQDETLAQLFARAASDGGIIPAASVLRTYEDIIAVAEGRLDEAFDLFPSVGVIVRPDPFGGFYIGPSFDGTRPGAFYAGTSNAEAWFPMRSLAYHETVPGHHLQIALAMEQDLPVFRKVARFTGFVEGWALYAERLTFELGWFDGDPYANLGRLQYEALRAARLVIDTGIHAFDWSFDEAVRFNQDNVGWSQGASQGAVARYSVSPGQASAYLVGMLVILDERQRAMDALGPSFDLKDFHHALLVSGAVPLALLDDVVDGYIAEASP